MIFPMGWWNTTSWGMTHPSKCQSTQRSGQVRLSVLISWFIIMTPIIIIATNNDVFHYRHLMSLLSFSEHFDVHYRLCSPGLYLRKDGEWVNWAKGTKWRLEKITEWGISREEHEERELNCFHWYKEVLLALKSRCNQVVLMEEEEGSCWSSELQTDICHHLLTASP